MRSLLIYACFLVTIFTDGCGQSSRPVTVAFWNVENLFDLEDNPKKNDEEFALGGKKNCTQEILDLKLDHLSEVLADLDADILGLCEVENRAVINMLNDRFIQRDYEVIHYESPDNRGIDNMLFFDPAYFSVIKSRPISIHFEDGKPTRDILYVKGKVDGDILHLFVNHWPSNYGGKEQAIPRRAKVARILRREIDAILKENPTAEILVMGDLNENPTDTAVKDILNSTPDTLGVPVGTNRLWNLMGWFSGVANSGTYIYRGEDYFLDQILVSPGLADDNGLAIVKGSISINDAPKYRQQKGKYERYPFRFWAGDKLLGGYSDHLAVSVQIEQK